MKSSETLRVLIVDDDPNNVATLKLLLKKEFPAEVVVALDCSSAREAFFSASFDLVTVDYKLPDGDGLTLLEEFTATEEHPPVIIVTGKGDEDSAAKAISLGSSGYVVKDGRMYMLFPEAIRRALEKEEYKRALRESEKKYRSFVENSRVIAFRGYRDFSADIFHGAVEEITGYTTEDFLTGKVRWDKLMHPDDYRDYIKDVERVMESGSGTRANREYRINRKNGGLRWVEEVVEVICDDSGVPLGVQGVINDITERKQYEEELSKYRENLEELVKERTSDLVQLNARLRAEITERELAEKELRRLNEELEAYAKTVSHELKTPLAGIWLALEYLERLSSKVSTDSFGEEATAIVNKAKSTVKKADEQVKSLLDLAAAGQVPTEVSDVDVSSVVEGILADVEEELSKKGAQVKLNGNLGTVRINPTHAHQIFSNLIINAIMHCDSSHPLIEISALGETTSGGHKYLVRDNGSGIPPEMLDSLFEPFVKGEGGGSGTGLAIVDKTIRTYGGEIRAYNDNGACFEFTLKDYEK